MLELVFVGHFTGLSCAALYLLPKLLAQEILFIIHGWRFGALYKDTLCTSGKAAEKAVIACPKREKKGSRVKIFALRKTSNILSINLRTSK